MDYKLLRKTYCQCSACQTVYRLSDSELTETDKFDKIDLLDKINKEIFDLEQKEEILKQKLTSTKELATKQGRLDADNHIGLIDTVFNPLGYNPADSKVSFHPVDFIVFNGMNDFENPKIKNIVLLDSKSNDSSIQQSIRNCVENEQYEFLTIKIANDGTVITE